MTAINVPYNQGNMAGAGHRLPQPFVAAMGHDPSEEALFGAVRRIRVWIDGISFALTQYKLKACNHAKQTFTGAPGTEAVSKKTSSHGEIRASCTALAAGP